MYLFNLRRYYYYTYIIWLCQQICNIISHYYIIIPRYYIIFPVLQDTIQDNKEEDQET